MDFFNTTEYRGRGGLLGDSPSTLFRWGGPFLTPPMTLEVQARTCVQPLGFSRPSVDGMMSHEKTSQQLGVYVMLSVEESQFFTCRGGKRYRAIFFFLFPLGCGLVFHHCKPSLFPEAGIAF
ncbi:hypothetical protein TNCV_1215561 [Trichonephila clavipes]|nr:hypothetical protein TNCV_1215561 [Trichonephila clavipes]